MILPCERASTSLTEPDWWISHIRLFHRTHGTVESVYSWCAMRGAGKG